MTVRILLAAIAAGLIAGLFMTPVLATKVVPVILHAEEYETGGHDHETAKADHVHEDGSANTADHQPVVAGKDAAPAHDQGQATLPEGEEEPLFLGRFLNTLLANLVTGAGYGLLLAGVSLAAGVRVNFTNGLAWGFGGWLCVQLLPALGLPPELPGFPHIDLTQRQIWWVVTVILSIAGFWFLLLYKSQWFRALGVVLLFTPHVYGAPQPEDISSAVPAYLASQFATGSLAATLFFWLVLGISLGWLWDWLERQKA
jgi:cobalt transporter subunit CbtA